MICSSVNLLFFMAYLLLDGWRKSILAWINFWGAGQREYIRIEVTPTFPSLRVLSVQDRIA